MGSKRVKLVLDEAIEASVRSGLLKRSPAGEITIDFSTAKAIREESRRESIAIRSDPANAAALKELREAIMGPDRK